MLDVVYFTRVPIHRDSDGGVLCCRANLEQLHAEARVHAIVAGPVENEQPTLDYFRARGMAGHFVRFSDPPFRALKPETQRAPFMLEVEAWQQEGVDKAMASFVRENLPRCIVVDYLPSAYYLPSLFDLATPVIVITLNREGDFCADLAARGFSEAGVPLSEESIRRCRASEDALHQRCSMVVAIGRYDRPPTGRSLWMPPSLEPRQDRWIYQGRRSLFFVGHRPHFPNRDAIDWIAGRLAPEIAAIDPSITIKILGASEDEMPSELRRSNLQYLGSGDKAQAADLFRSEAAMLAPIANDYGAKFKIAEAISYGTPLLPTAGALSGTAVLPWLPPIDIDQPAQAAAMAVDLVQSQRAQEQMSEAIRSAAAAFHQHQAGRWKRLLNVVLGEG